VDYTEDRLVVKPPEDRWMAMWFPGAREQGLRFHFYSAAAKMSACSNYRRPFMALTTNDPNDGQACPRCIEAHTFAGKPAPRFP
jgi:hypothetical protein